MSRPARKPKAVAATVAALAEQNRPVAAAAADEAAVRAARAVPAATLEDVLLWLWRGQVLDPQTGQPVRLAGLLRDAVHARAAELIGALPRGRLKRDGMVYCADGKRFWTEFDCNLWKGKPAGRRDVVISPQGPNRQLRGKPPQKDKP